MQVSSCSKKSHTHVWVNLIRANKRVWNFNPFKVNLPPPSFFHFHRGASANKKRALPPFLLKKRNLKLIRQLSCEVSELLLKNKDSLCFLNKALHEFSSFKMRSWGWGVRAKTKLERLHSVRNNSNFEIAALFPSLYRCWKSAAISELELFLTEWSRFYIVLALVCGLWGWSEFIRWSECMSKMLFYDFLISLSFTSFH